MAMVTEEKVTKPRIGIVNFERRKYPRINVDLPIEYFHTNSSIGHTGHALNASESGLLIYFPEQVEVGQYLNVKIFFSLTAELITIGILAEVVWVDIHLGKDWGDYRCGVKIIDISPEDRTKLKNFLMSLAQ